MEKSTVYFTDFRCPVGTSQLDKLKKLCIAAGIKDIDMEGKFVAIKMHFGELGNMAFLRPNYAKVVSDLCKEQGGLPFLTDCNTLYPGSRKSSSDMISPITHLPWEAVRSRRQTARASTITAYARSLWAVKYGESNRFLRRRNMLYWTGRS